MTNHLMELRAHHYAQFDADYNLDVPAEGYGGWQSVDVDISLEHTALVVMHAWDVKSYEAFPGWYRHVEYLSRANDILRTVFPKLLHRVRASNMRIFHVVSEGDYYRGYPGYAESVRLAGPEPPRPEQVPADPAVAKLRAIKASQGRHNAADIERALRQLSFAPEAEPVGDEGIAESSHQLFALCRSHSVNHLIYTGFAINWCLLLSPGGMAAMSEHGIMCSVVRQAVTAVENKETARNELCKEMALWRVAVAFGFVFDADDLLEALTSS